MITRRESFWEKRIPTLLAVFLLMIGLGVTTYLVQTQTNWFGHASPSETPQQVRITNLTDSSFTLTYITTDKVIGSVAYGKDSSLGQVGLDDRDQTSGVPSPYQVHSITVRNLTPNTQYSFSISSGASTYLNNNALFTIKTFDKVTDTPPTQDPIAGKLLNADGTNPAEALVYITIPNAQTISTTLKASGLYIIPTNSLRTADGKSYITISPTTNMQLLAIGSDGSSSHVVISASTRNPVPTINLGSDYDFSVGITPLASSSALPVNFPNFGLDANIQVTEVQITQPTNNESFSDQQPLFKGTASPNSQVQITIHSDVVTTQVSTDSSGAWTYRATTPLPPGQHTITITSKDALGIIHTIQKTFVILASGTQVVEAATPSATPIVKLTLTPSPSPSQGPVQVTPTIMLTLTPPAQGITVKPTHTPGSLPPTGNESIITGGIVGIITTVIGLGVFLLSRGVTL